MEESFLIKLHVLKTATFLKRDSRWKKRHRCFPVKFAKFLRTPFFYRTSPVTPSESFRFPVCSFIKKETRKKMLFCEFCKIFKNIFWQNLSGWLLLVLSVNFEKFFGTPLSQSTSGKLLISCTRCTISTNRYSKTISQKYSKLFV